MPQTASFPSVAVGTPAKPSWGARFVGWWKEFFTPPASIKVGSEKGVMLEELMAQAPGMLPASMAPTSENVVRWKTMEFAVDGVIGKKLQASGSGELVSKNIYSKDASAWMREVVRAFLKLSDPDEKEIEQRARREFQRQYPDLSVIDSKEQKRERFEAILKDEKEKAAADKKALEAQRKQIEALDEQAERLENELKKLSDKDTAYRQKRMELEALQLQIDGEQQTLATLLSQQVSEVALLDYLTRTGETAKAASQAADRARKDALAQKQTAEEADRAYQQVYDQTLKLTQDREGAARTFYANIIKMLGDKAVADKIEEETEFKLNTKRRIAFYILGKLFALIYALGCACATAGALLVVLPAAPIALPVLVFIGGFFVNYALSRSNTPNVFAYMFDMFKRISWPKRIVLGAGLLLAVSTGVVAGIFAYTGAMSIIVALGITASAAFPPLFGAIAVISALVIATVMLRGMVNASKGNVGEKFVNFWKNLFKRRLVPYRDAHGVESMRLESNLRYGLRMAFTGLFFGLFLLVSCIGCALNMYSGFQSLAEMFMKLHQLPLIICQNIALAIAVFSFVGEFKFHADTAKENTQTLTNDIANLWRQFKEAWRGERYVSVGKVILIGLLGLGLLKILAMNVFGNVFPAAKGAGADVVFTGSMAGAESLADTLREFMEFIQAAAEEVSKFYETMKEWGQDIFGNHRSNLRPFDVPSDDLSPPPPPPPSPGDDSDHEGERPFFGDIAGKQYVPARSSGGHSQVASGAVTPAPTQGGDTGTGATTVSVMKQLQQQQVAIQPSRSVVTITAEDVRQAATAALAAVHTTSLWQRAPVACREEVAQDTQLQDDGIRAMPVAV